MFNAAHLHMIARAHTSGSEKADSPPVGNLNDYMREQLAANKARALKAAPHLHKSPDRENARGVGTQPHDSSRTHGSGGPGSHVSSQFSGSSGGGRSRSTAGNGNGGNRKGETRNKKKSKTARGRKSRSRSTGGGKKAEKENARALPADGGRLMSPSQSVLDKTIEHLGVGTGDAHFLV